MTTIEVFVSYRQEKDLGRSNLIVKSVEGGFVNIDTGIEVLIYHHVDEKIGAVWPEEITRRVSSADIFLALIGPEWLAATDPYSRRRIDQESDWVRKEIALALEGEATVIPVLFDGAPMPPREALPPSISALADRRALNVRTSSLFLDVQPLLQEIARYGASRKSGNLTANEQLGVDEGWPYPDPPLLVKPAQMSDLDIGVAVNELLEDWVVTEGFLPEDPSRKRVEIYRKLQFDSFRSAIDFMNDVGDFSEKMNHHPRWENIYKTVWVYLTSWDIGHRISHLDVVLACHVDSLAIKYGAAIVSSRIGD